MPVRGNIQEYPKNIHHFFLFLPLQKKKKNAGNDLF